MGIARDPDRNCIRIDPLGWPKPPDQAGMMHARRRPAPSTALTPVLPAVKVIPGTRGPFVNVTRRGHRRAPGAGVSMMRSIACWLLLFSGSMVVGCGSRTPLQINPTDAAETREASDDGGPDSADSSIDVTDAEV